MELSVSLQSTPEEWVFFREGGANMVFRYIGSNGLFKRKILRIRKQDQLSQDFITIPCLSRYISELTPVSLTHQWVLDLLKNNERFREPWRIASHPIQHHIEVAHLQEDFHFGNFDTKRFCSYEIKPKWHGALSAFDTSNIDDQAHIALCRYCEHNYPIEALKKDRYCPSDLFSGDKERILRAISMLSVDPKNNFHAFFGGDPIYPPTIPGAMLKDLASILFSDEFLTVLHKSIQDAWFNCSAESFGSLTTAATLRDCSFIVQMKPNNDYNILMIDLNEKPRSKLTKYMDEYKELYCKLGKFI